ncbi:ASN_collapsed_G0025890.mRNA.1.CDS.1 [Saccharomyces cerevisiae]|nr:ASN_collapsed_G0025890.mRNA.1.CDS.1 [Saccharomyces cerevisiae]
MAHNQSTAWISVLVWKTRRESPVFNRGSVSLHALLFVSPFGLLLYSTSINVMKGTMPRRTVLCFITLNTVWKSQRQKKLKPYQYLMKNNTRIISHHPALTQNSHSFR